MADTYNQEETMKGTTLEKEYDASFDGDEKANNLLKLTSNAFTRTYKRIAISEIGLTDPIKRARLKTMRGLTSTVKDIGVVNPIHVMTIDIDDEDEETKYILLDGLRRMYGAKRNGQDEIDAIVWDFKDKDQGTDLAMFLSMMLNRNQKHTWSEVWDLYQILELQSDITPGTLEYLLQLESGDAMKLKDVMLCDYPEVKDTLLTEKKNLEGCYKMLQKLRKEEDLLDKEDVTGVAQTNDDASEITANNVGESGELSDEEVRELLELTEDLDELNDVEDTDFKDMNKAAEGFEERQTVGERHPIDTALRQAVLARDKFTCTCCGLNMGAGSRNGLIAVHHKIPVHCKGKDTLENLTTLCLNCHITLHIMERNGGSIMMSKDDFDALSETEQLSLRKILKLARVAVVADGKAGLTKEDIKKKTQDSVRHPMPGTGLSENQAAYAKFKASMKEDK